MRHRSFIFRCEATSVITSFRNPNQYPGLTSLMFFQSTENLLLITIIDSNRLSPHTVRISSSPNAVTRSIDAAVHVQIIIQSRNFFISREFTYGSRGHGRRTPAPHAFFLLRAPVHRAMEKREPAGRPSPARSSLQPSGRPGLALQSPHPTSPRHLTCLSSPPAPSDSTPLRHLGTLRSLSTLGTPQYIMYHPRHSYHSQPTIYLTQPERNL